MWGFGSRVGGRRLWLPIIGLILLVILAAALTVPLWASSVEPILAAHVNIAAANQIRSADATNSETANNIDQPNNAKDAKDDENAATTDRAWLGIALVDANGGAKVVQVVSESPASKAGVKADDIITTIDGQAVANAKTVVDVMQARKSGDKVTLGITRGNDKMQIEVTAGTMPANPKNGTTGRPQLGRRGLPPELQGLDSIPLNEMFGHFISGTFHLKDQSGKDLTINITPGSVVTTTANSLTIKPNDGAANQQFSVADTTVIVGSVQQGKIENLKVDTKVLVITVNDPTHASHVAISGNTYSPLEEIVPQMRVPRLWSMPGTSPFRAAPPKNGTSPSM